MTTPILFRVIGHPRPQPRPRWVGGRMVSTADKKAKLWRACVEAAAVRVKSDFAAGGLPGWLGGPVSVAMTFMFGVADKKRWNQPKTSRGDIDNLSKVPMDIMEKVGLLPKGDARVVHLDARKIWAKVGGLIMVLKPMADDLIVVEEIKGAPKWLTA